MIQNLKECFLRMGIPYSVYSNYLCGDSFQDILSSMCALLNEVINNVNEYNKIVDALKKWIEEEGLQIAVDKKLEEMIDDGTFDTIINQKIFGDLSTRIDNYKIINVLEYGLDNSGDETKADINDIKMVDVINVLKKEKGGMVYFPTGTYVFKKGFTIDGISSFTLTGGSEKSILKTIGCSDFITIKNSISGFRMSNLYLYNNYTSSCGLKLFNNHHQKISDVRIQGFKGDGLNVEGCFISTFENIFSIENQEIGGNFWSDGIDPANNIMRIVNCNFSKNGEWNIKIDDNYIWDIQGLDAEQFDYININENAKQTKGSIYIVRPLFCKIDGLYIETYKRGSVPNFLNEYVTIKIGDKASNKSATGVTIENYLISNNGLGKNGIYLDYCRGVHIGTGEIKGCLKGIQNNDENNTVIVSPFTLFTGNTQNVDSAKKLIGRNEFTTTTDVSGIVDAGGGNILIHNCNQYQRIESVDVYYVENTNNYVSQRCTIKIGSENVNFDLLPNKTAPFVQRIRLDKYCESGTNISVVIPKQEQAVGKIQFIIKYFNTLL